MTDDVKGSPAQGVAETMSPARRRAIYAGVAAVAAATGSAWAWWRFQPHAVDAGPGAEKAEQRFFTQHFASPDGGAIEAASFSGRPLLLNFWATWCPPCVAELPMLSEFFMAQEARGWQVLGLAVDQPSAVRKFLARSPVAFPIGMAGLEGTEISRSLGNLTGGLPFTIVFDSAGQVHSRKMGQLQATDLGKWASQVA